MSLLPNQLADIVCSKCGQNNPAMALYCRNCGTNLPLDVSGIPKIVTVSGKVTIGRWLKPYEISFFNDHNGRLWDTVPIYHGQYSAKLRNLTDYVVFEHYRKILFRGSRQIGTLKVQNPTDTLSADWTR